jgi:multidrug efflux pump
MSAEEHHHRSGLTGRFFNWFNSSYDQTQAWYRHNLEKVLNHSRLVMAVYAVILIAVGVMFYRLPTGFLPDEDQGFIMTLINLPTGATQAKTLAVANQVTDYYLQQEKKNVELTFTVAGVNPISGVSQNSGVAFTKFIDWGKRPGKQNSAAAIAQRAFMRFFGNPQAQVFPLVFPSVPELGFSTGFDLQMQDRANLGHEALMQARNQLLGMAMQNGKLAQVRPASLDDSQQLHVDIDQEKANALGISTASINATLSTAWGGAFVNNFIDRDRVKRVYMQGDAPYRMKPEDLDRWYVRTSTGTMAPFSSFARASWAMGPLTLNRYNGYPSIEIQGQGAPGVSSGTALAEMDKIFKSLPQGITNERTGLSYQEQQSGAQAPALYALSILIVYLCLAALYESWAIPLSVMLVIPLGVIGALAATSLRGLFNDIYFQVGLLTTIGLSAKNAILIVEFAVDAEKKGMTARAAALEAARLRLRPILMTSIAFIAGVFPLAVASGAGAGSQNDIGTGVIGGMLTATILAIFFVPVFFQLINRGLQHHE